jgi:hypothetical protein
MKFIIEDENEGVESLGYYTVRVVDDAGDVMLDADVAPEWYPDSADELLSLARLLKRLEGGVGL